MCAEFSAAAELSVTLAQGEASSVRRELERELANIEVGTGSAAPTGGGGAVGGRGPERAGIDLARRQLGEQETIVDLLQEQNELLEDGVGGGGGGGARAGLAGGLAAGGAGGLAATAAGVGAAAFPLAASAALLSQNDPQAAREGRQVPGGRVDLPEIPDIGFDVPPVFQRLAEGLGMNINLNSNVNIDAPAAGGEGRRQFAEADFADSREVESLVRSELNRFEQRLKRELGGGTTARTGGGGNARVR